MGLEWSLGVLGTRVGWGLSAYEQCSTNFLWNIKAPKQVLNMRAVCTENGRP